jgi:hypothetical protein
MKKFAIALVTATMIAGLLLTQVVVAAPATEVSSVSWGCGGYYVIHYGDNLSRIAQNCGTSIGNILAHNPQIYNPHWIYAGMVLNLTGSGYGNYFRPQSYSNYYAPRSYGNYYRPPVYNNNYYQTRPVIYNYSSSKSIYHYNMNPWYGSYYSPGRWWYGGYSNPGQYYGSYYRYSYNPGVDLSTYVAASGQNITAAPSGFPANAAIDIRVGLQGLGPYANYTGTTNSSGFYTMTVPIPSVAAQGQYWYVQVVGAGVQAYSRLVYIK